MTETREGGGVAAPPDGDATAPATPKVEVNPKIAEDALSRAADKGGALRQFANWAAMYRENVTAGTEPGLDGTGSNGTWRYDGWKRLHIICLAPSFYLNHGIKDVSTPDGYDKAVRLGEAVLRHETWHGRATDRSPEAARWAMDKWKVPSVLLNLFEDARIEAIGRDMDKRPFGWLDLALTEEGLPDTDKAYYMFQFFTVDEERSGVGVMPTAIAEKWTGEPTVRWRGKTYITVELIHQFWLDATYAKDTRSLWPILREWMEVFGGEDMTEPPPHPVSMKGVPGDGGDGDMDEDADEGGKGDGEGKEKDGKDRSFGYGSGNKYAGVRKPVPIDPSALKKKKVETPIGTVDRSFYTDGSADTDTSKSKELADRFRRMVAATDSSKQRTTVSSSRLHVPKLVGHEGDCFRSPVMRSGKRRLCVIMDMSGSMSHNFAVDGGNFLAAMLRLHRQGTMHVDIYLSGGGNCHRLSNSTTEADIRYLHASCGTESIDRTLRYAKLDAQAADTVLIYTDGHLTDGDVKAGQWRQLGVDLIGVAVDPDNHSATNVGRLLRQHFAKGFVESSGHKLAMRIVQYVLTR